MIKERILNLLTLFMDAQDKGFDLKLEVSTSNSNRRVDLWHYGIDNGKYFLIGHKDEITEIEDYLKGLLSCGITKA